MTASGFHYLGRFVFVFFIFGLTLLCVFSACWYPDPMMFVPPISDGLICSCMMCEDMVVVCGYWCFLLAHRTLHRFFVLPPSSCRMFPFSLWINTALTRYTRLLCYSGSTLSFECTNGLSRNVTCLSLSCTFWENLYVCDYNVVSTDIVYSVTLLGGSRGLRAFSHSPWLFLGWISSKLIQIL